MDKYCKGVAVYITKWFIILQTMIKGTIENEANYRLIVENIADLIIVANTNGKHLF